MHTFSIFIKIFIINASRCMIRCTIYFRDGINGSVADYFTLGKCLIKCYPGQNVVTGMLFGIEKIRIVYYQFSIMADKTKQKKQTTLKTILLTPEDPAFLSSWLSNLRLGIVDAKLNTLHGRSLVVLCRLTLCKTGELIVPIIVTKVTQHSAVGFSSCKGSTG